VIACTIKAEQLTEEVSRRSNLLKAGNPEPAVRIYTSPPPSRRVALHSRRIREVGARGGLIRLAGVSLWGHTSYESDVIKWTRLGVLSCGKQCEY